MRRLRAWIVGLVMVVAAAGCDEQLRDLTGPTPDLQPTFSSIQRDIFSMADSAGRPGCTSCHNTRQARFSGNLNLEGAAAYAQLVGVPSANKPGAVRVVPGDPGGSYLVQKIEGAPGIVGTRMPQNGPFLTPGQVLVIRRWIQLGAPNN